MAFHFYIPEKPIAEMLMRACEMHLVKKVKTGKDNEKYFFSSVRILKLSLLLGARISSTIWL